MLQFFAYDIAVTDKEDPLDGTNTRQQLDDWGFSLAMPSIQTDLDWNFERNETTDTVTIPEEWFEREFVESGELDSLTGYYEALMMHREARL